MQIWPFFQFYFQAGIGTDATMHDHIKKLLDRCYATKDENTRFSPTNLVCIPFDSLLYICMQMSCNYPIWSCFSFIYMFPLVCFLKRTNTHLNSDLTRILCILSNVHISRCGRCFVKSTDFVCKLLLPSQGYCYLMSESKLLYFAYIRDAYFSCCTWMF